MTPVGSGDDTGGMRAMTPVASGDDTGYAFELLHAHLRVLTARSAPELM
jgi:hypothetical protein